MAKSREKYHLFVCVGQIQIKKQLKVTESFFLAAIKFILVQIKSNSLARSSSVSQFIHNRDLNSQS